MLDIANDIRSLSDFKRNTSELLDQLKKTGNPLVLTINGKAEGIVQDAEAYQELLERVETIEGIQRGLADLKGWPNQAGARSVQPTSTQARHTALNSPKMQRPSSKSHSCGSSGEHQARELPGANGL